ncbi:MAG: BlaI/MecI/CopY family transcriptional regulator [Candidatus Aminicenantales bacterium]
MQILWQLEKSFVKDILENLPEPKPAYNTVSTIVRILEKKGFVSHKAYGKTHEYFPLISKDAYKKFFIRSLVNNYFGNSYRELVSFFARDKNMTVIELESLKKIISEEIQKQKAREDE